MARTDSKEEGFRLLPEPGAGRDKFDELKFSRKFVKKAPQIRARADDWFAFDGKAWRPTARDRFRSLAMSVLPEKHRIVRHAKAILDHAEWTYQLSAGEELRSAVMFESPGIVLVNCESGVLRVTKDTVQVLPHNPDYRFTGCLAASWDEKKVANHEGRPLFRKLLNEALSDKEDIDLFKWFCGYLLFPDCKQNELFLICYGPGGSGKSTIADAVVGTIADTTLVTRLSLAQICTSGPGSYSLPTLQSALVNLGTELDTVEMDESANFKKLVSGEPIVARSIYGKPFEMMTTCKLWFLANSLPRFKSGTDAELRRARFLAFTRKPKEKDPTLKDRVLLERDSIFAWIVESLMWILAGVPCPIGGVESKNMLRRFELSNDPVGSFIKDRLILDPEAETTKDSIIHAFSGFLEAHQFPHKTREFFFRAFYERCPNIEVKRYKHRDPEYWIRGVGLREESDSQG